MYFCPRTDSETDQARHSLRSPLRMTGFCLLQDYNFCTTDRNSFYPFMTIIHVRRGQWNKDNRAGPSTARLPDHSQLFHLLYHSCNLVSVEQWDSAYWLLDWRADARKDGSYISFLCQLPQPKQCDQGRLPAPTYQ